jgi:hypothetical protein
VRFTSALLLAALSSYATADRLINTPTGRKIPYGTVRLEVLSEFSRGRTQEYSAGIGVSPDFDLEIRSQYFEGQGVARTFDLGYTYISPVPGLTPGLSVGVQDALDETVDGIRTYFAFTYRPVFSTLNGDVPADFTVGGYVGNFSAPFIGGTIPFSREFRFLYEHNGIRVAAGFEIRPRPDLGLRMIVRDNDVLGSIQFTHRF